VRALRREAVFSERHPRQEPDRPPRMVTGIGSEARLKRESSAGWAGAKESWILEDYGLCSCTQQMGVRATTTFRRRGLRIYKDLTAGRLDGPLTGLSSRRTPLSIGFATIPRPIGFPATADQEIRKLKLGYRGEDGADPRSGRCPGISLRLAFPRRPMGTKGPLRPFPVRREQLVSSSPKKKLASKSCQPRSRRKTAKLRPWSSMMAGWSSPDDSSKARPLRPYRSLPLTALVYRAEAPEKKSLK